MRNTLENIRANRHKPVKPVRELMLRVVEYSDGTIRLHTKRDNEEKIFTIPGEIANIDNLYWYLTHKNDPEWVCSLDHEDVELSEREINDMLRLYRRYRNKWSISRFYRYFEKGQLRSALRELRSIDEEVRRARQQEYEIIRERLGRGELVVRENNTHVCRIIKHRGRWCMEYTYKDIRDNTNAITLRFPVGRKVAVRVARLQFIRDMEEMSIRDKPFEIIIHKQEALIRIPTYRAVKLKYTIHGETVTMIFLGEKIFMKTTGHKVILAQMLNYQHRDDTVSGLISAIKSGKRGTLVEPDLNTVTFIPFVITKEYVPLYGGYVDVCTIPLTIKKNKRTGEITEIHEVSTMEPELLAKRAIWW